MIILMAIFFYRRMRKVHKRLFGESITSDELEEIFGGQFEVFISYQWKHQDLVKKIKECLDNKNIKSWMDIGEIKAGDELYAAIEKGIRAAKIFIVCVSKEYTLSANCTREINLAADLKKYIIPLLVSKNVEWPPKGMATAVAGKLYIDFTVESAFDENIRNLADKINDYIP